MEFLIGSIVTLFGLYLFRKGITPVLSKPNAKIKYSQSFINDMTFGLAMSEPMFPKTKIVSQSSNYERENTTRIIYLDGKAWWIESGSLVAANLDEEGNIDFDSKKGVDTMTMDKVELDKTIFIVDKLTEGL
jgi:hypothetical protein